ncbi:unnamed protein product, partial [Nesidiocoris tenuis]
MSSGTAPSPDCWGPFAIGIVKPYQGTQREKIYFPFMYRADKLAHRLIRCMSG